MLEGMSDDNIMELQRHIHRMSILIGVSMCGSIDRHVLIDQIFQDKHGHIPRESISQVVDLHLDTMVGEEIVEENRKWLITPELRPVVAEYMMMLDGQETVN
jgi:hypothetical protein